MWYIVICLVLAYIGFKFFSAYSKDADDLQSQPLHEKFAVVVGAINDVAFDGMGSVTTFDKRSFNLYETGQNQIVSFLYGTGHLTITWKYKYFQKELVHSRQFNDVRNLSIFEQQRLADIMIAEMRGKVARHKEEVLGGI